jgi:hypothetical protein
LEQKKAQLVHQWAKGFQNLYSQWAFEFTVESFYLVGSNFSTLFRTRQEKGKPKKLEAVLLAHKEL